MIHVIDEELHNSAITQSCLRPLTTVLEDSTAFLVREIVQLTIGKVSEAFLDVSHVK